MDHTHDVLLLGRGLAGAVLTEVLQRRGLRVHVYDFPRAGQASRVAAGVVNPIVLKRDVSSWRAARLLPLAHAFYATAEHRWDARFWHPKELVKLFSSTADQHQWERAMADPAIQPFLDRRDQPSLEGSAVNAEHGHGTVHACAWLDVTAFLAAQERRLEHQGALSHVDVQEANITMSNGGVRIGEHTAPWLVRCTGPFASLAGLAPVKGEGLSVRLPGLPEDRMLHRGVFTLPQGNGLFKVGSTFAWADIWDGPTVSARDSLLGKLKKLTAIAPEVVDHWAGIRPAARDRRPLIGVTGPHEAVLNGLGSRGVMLAPWCAEHLVAHLFDGSDLDAEVRADRDFQAHR